eukprot:COSAG03_NODE_3282_length_2103_cov_3.483533_2_plen_138_part_00
MGARCLYYRREDPTARAGSGRDHYQIILSSVGMLDDAAECGPDGHGADGVHKLVEDDVTVDAIMCCKRCTKDTHPHVTELHGGHDVLDSRLACISVTTQEGGGGGEAIFIRSCAPERKLGSTNCALCARGDTIRTCT